MKNILIALLLFPSFLFAQQNRGLIFWDSAENVNSPIFTGFNGNVRGGYTGRVGNQLYSTYARTTARVLRGSASYYCRLANSPNDGAVDSKAQLTWNFLPAGSPLGTVGDQTAFYRQPLNVRWFGESILIPSSNLDYNTVTSVLFNTKSVEDEYGTTSYIAMELGRFYLFITPVNSNNVAQQVQKHDLGPVVYDQRIDWIMNRNFTRRDSGYLRIYRNDSLVFSRVGRGAGGTLTESGNWKDDGLHSVEPYMQTGLYKWAFQSFWTPAPNVNVVEAYYDDIRYFTGEATLADVSLKSREAGTPPPVPNQPPTAAIPAAAPTNLTTLQLIATTSADVSTWNWSLLQGRAGVNVGNSNKDTLRATGLDSGVYIFRLIVSDPEGLKDTADVTVVKLKGRGIILRDGAEEAGKPVIGGGGFDITQGYAARVGVTTNVLQRSNEWKNTGAWSYKFELVNSDSTGWQRTDNELAWYFPPNTSPAGWYWSGITIMVPQENAGDNTTSTVAFNRFLFPGGVKINYLQIRSGNWFFVHKKYNSAGVEQPERHINLGPVEYGTGVNWVLKRNYTLADTGTIQLYKNKLLVYQDNGPNANLTGQRPEPYEQFGIWKPGFDSAQANKTKVTFFFDDVTFADYAATLEQVAANQPPQIIGVAELITASDTAVVPMQTSDPDGPKPVRTWTKVSGPTSNILAPASDTLRAVLSSPGVYLFELTAVDNNGASVSRTVSVTKEAAPNFPPIVRDSVLQLYRNGDSIRLVFVGTDPENDSLTYQLKLVSGPARAQLTIIAGNTATPILTNLVSGNYTIEMEVTDSAGNTTSWPVRFGYRRHGEIVNFKGFFEVIQYSDL